MNVFIPKIIKYPLKNIKRGVAHWGSARFDYKPKLLVLLYHKILPQFKPDPKGINIGLKTFIKQIEELSGRYPIISLTDAIEQCRSRQPRAEIQIVLTFDDGYREQYESVFPYLKKKGLPAVIFLSANLINNGDSLTIGNGYISWEQANEMDKAGIEIGAHGLSHSSLAKIPFFKAKEEINKSKEVIEQKLKKPCYHFAFPYGARQDFNQALIDCVKESEFRSCMLNIHGYNHLDKDLFCFKRIIMEEMTDAKYILG